MSNITVPLGWERGELRSIEAVLSILMMEMLGHRSDLLDLRDKAEEPDEMLEYQSQANLLEKYAVAVSVVYYQMRVNKPAIDNIAGLIELAEKHAITLPDWMRIKA